VCNVCVCVCVMCVCVLILMCVLLLLMDNNGQCVMCVLTNSNVYY